MAHRPSPMQGGKRHADDDERCETLPTTAGEGTASVFDMLDRLGPRPNVQRAMDEARRVG